MILSNSIKNSLNLIKNNLILFKLLKYYYKTFMNISTNIIKDNTQEIKHDGLTSNTFRRKMEKKKRTSRSLCDSGNRNEILFRIFYFV